MIESGQWNQQSSKDDEDETRLEWSKTSKTKHRTRNKRVSVFFCMSVARRAQTSLKIDQSRTELRLTISICRYCMAIHLLKSVFIKNHLI